jgi:hypothetical protein
LTRTNCDVSTAPTGLAALWQYALVNNFFIHYITRFLFGFNVYPYGPRHFRKVFEFVLGFLCMSDLCLWGIALFDSYCASSNPTACKDHTSLLLTTLLWPGAFLIAPISGLATIILGPSSSLARVYAWWSRLAAINNLLLLQATIDFHTYYEFTTGSFYPVILISSSRLLQCLCVDLYVAHVERLRFTRGWDGLHTSLFKTRDNKKEIVI